MRILIDINHPAHVHYFKNFIRKMESKKHQFLVISRDKEIEHYLLKKYNIYFINRGRGEKGIYAKIKYMIKTDFFNYGIAKKFNPDLLLSFDSVYLSHVSRLMNIPHISFDDTEHARFEHLLSFPFTKTILTPSCYLKDLGKKQIRFDGYMELCYLHPNYFKPNSTILNMLGVKKNDKYIIIRFVSWNAAHDIGQKGLRIEEKYKLVYELSKYAKVFISSEGELPENLKRYQITIPPEQIHDALAYATLFIGEGATMASECAVLGIPAIYINSLEVGYCTEEENKYNLIFNFRSSEGVLEKAIELVKSPDLRNTWQQKRKKMLEDKIDVTAFMVWFIENYPQSVKIMQENPDYQYNFK